MMRDKEMSPRGPITFSSICRNIRGQKVPMAPCLLHARCNADAQMGIKGRRYQGIVYDYYGIMGIVHMQRTYEQSELPKERGDSSRSKELPGLGR